MLDTDKIKGRESKYITMENHQLTKDDNEKGKKEQRKYKRARKQRKGWQYPYLSITYFNTDGLDYPMKWHRVAE